MGHLDDSVHRSELLKSDRPPLAGLNFLSLFKIDLLSVIFIKHHEHYDSVGHISINHRPEWSTISQSQQISTNHRGLLLVFLSTIIYSEAGTKLGNRWGSWSTAIHVTSTIFNWWISFISSIMTTYEYIHLWNEFLLDDLQHHTMPMQMSECNFGSILNDLSLDQRWWKFLSYTSYIYSLPTRLQTRNGRNLRSGRLP